MSFISSAAGRARRAWLSRWLAGRRAAGPPTAPALFRPLADEPFVGEIILFAGSYAPRGWALCDGSLLPIASNQALFSLLGVRYGGDGRTTFGLPDLRGRVPVHRGQGPGLTNRPLGSRGGAEQTALTPAQLPAHPNLPAASASLGTTASPAGAYPANGGAGAALFSPEAAQQVVQPSAALGGGQAHNNLQPYLGVSYLIALVGLYPPRE